jgi:hypothetical protein
MHLSKTPSFGLDPEILVQKDDKIVCPLVFATVPKEVTPFGAAGGYNRDGMALELNPNPSHIIREVSANLHTLLKQAIDMAGLYGFKLSKSLHVNISEALNADNLPGDVYEIGCEPDYNAYTRKVNQVKVDPSKYLDRFCGGHIHIGVGSIQFPEACELVKLFDYHAGLLSVMYSLDIETARRRRETYGKAGAFRFDEEKGKIEYRVPDASWLWVEEGFENLCAKMTQALVEFRAGIRINDPKYIIQAIDNVDQELAQDLMGDPFSKAMI